LVVGSLFLPVIAWARLRVFSDGTADACWDEGTTLYGFDGRDFAAYFLAEEEYSPLAGFDPDDERKYGIPFTALRVPFWSDSAERAFKYFGTY
jgi:hypothetical protein